MCIITRSMNPKPRGDEAARLRKKKFDLIRRWRISPDAIGGSLALTHRRCGKPTCHCASGQGHPLWSLTFMVNGKKHVERIPPEWVEEMRRGVLEGRAMKEAVTTLLTVNAQLWVLWRKQQGL